MNHACLIFTLYKKTFPSWRLRAPTTHHQPTACYSATATADRRLPFAFRRRVRVHAAPHRSHLHVGPRAASWPSSDSLPPSSPRSPFSSSLRPPKLASPPPPPLALLPPRARQEGRGGEGEEAGGGPRHGRAGQGGRGRDQRPRAAARRAGAPRRRGRRRSRQDRRRAARARQDPVPGALRTRSSSLARPTSLSLATDSDVSWFNVAVV